MFKRLMCLLFCVLAFGTSAAEAAGYDRAAYWDPTYYTNWSDVASAAAIKDGVAAAGYTILNAAELKTWMDGHIADGELSVVIFCNDVAPETVAESMAATCTLRQYLNAGGKIVQPADIPFYNVAHAGGGNTTWGDAGAGAILGFQTADAPRDSMNTVTFTDDGLSWGLTVPWQSQRPALASTAAAQNLTVLATDKIIQ